MVILMPLQPDRIQQGKMLEVFWLMHNHLLPWYTSAKMHVHEATMYSHNTLNVLYTQSPLHTENTLQHTNRKHNHSAKPSVNILFLVYVRLRLFCLLLQLCSFHSWAIRCEFSPRHLYAISLLCASYMLYSHSTPSRIERRSE